MKKKIALVASPGGHLVEMLSLKEAWSDYEVFWVTADSVDTRAFLREHKVFYAHAPFTRNIRNMFRNFFLGLRLLKQEKPDLIISTGGGISVPLFYAAFCRRIKTVYIESLTRINTLSMTGKLIYPVTDLYLVQWPELAEKHKKTEYRGTILG